MRISDEYRELNAECHTTNAGWGKGGLRWIDCVMAALPDHAGKVLDYGCGKGALVRELTSRGIDADGYDPAVPAYSRVPVEKYDLVVCTDVLEHVEPAALVDVLTHIRSLTTEVTYMVIGLTPAVKLLPDGTNAHRIIAPASWWEEQLQAHFSVIQQVDARITTAEYMTWV